MHNLHTFSSSMTVPFSSVCCTMASTLIDMLTRSIYEKKHAKNSITAMLNRVGTFAMLWVKIQLFICYRLQTNNIVLVYWPRHIYLLLLFLFIDLWLWDCYYVLHKPTARTWQWADVLLFKYLRNFGYTNV